MPGYNPRRIPEYRPQKDAVKARDLNEIVKRIMRLEQMKAQWPLQITNHPNNPIFTLDDELDGGEFGYYYNDSSTGQDCPPYGILAITDNYNDGIIKAKRPSTTFQTDYIVDCGEGCVTGRIGKYQKQFEKVILYDGSVPSSGDYYGPKPDTFGANQWYPTGFKILGIVDSDIGLAKALYYPIHKIRGKTDGSSHAKGTDFTLNVYTGNDVDTTWDVTINNDYIDIEASVLWVHATLIAGKWELAGKECSVA